MSLPLEPRRLFVRCTRPLCLTTSVPSDASVSVEQPLSAEQVRFGLRVAIAEGALATICGSLTSDAILAGYALLLGATPAQIGVLGAVPFIGQMAQMAGAYLDQRYGCRRRLVIWGTLVSRLIWPLLLLLLLPSISPTLRPPLLVILLVLLHSLNGMAANGWLSWMSDLVPEQWRGSYFGSRNTVLGVVGMAAGYGAATLLDMAHSRGQETVGFATLFIGCGIIALLAALAMAYQPHPPRQAQCDLQGKRLLLVPFADRQFTPFVLLAAGWALVTGLAGPFFPVFGLTQLHVSFATLALMGTVTTGVSLLSQPILGWLQDRLGDRVVLATGMAGTALLPWGWIACTPERTWPLWLVAATAGIVWPAVHGALATLSMSCAPAAGRASYLAVYGLVTGSVASIAGLLGGLVASSLTDQTLSLGPLTLGNLTLLFVLSSLGRLAIALLFLSIPSVRATCDRARPGRR